MTNNKSTKRALLTSTISLMLCFAMLLGTTFAWFTDSAATASNVITSGNLDVDVQYTLDGINWKALDGADDLFQKGLWEPGHTEVVALKVTNNGSLALKYTANMNILSEKKGTTKDDKDIILSEILTVNAFTFEAAGIDPVMNMDIAAKTLEEAFKGENNVAWGTASSFKATNVLGNAESAILNTGDVEYILIKVDMAESVGNEANHKGIGFEPTINFGINVVATQFTYEDDTFGNEYDKDATLDYYPVSNADELRIALENKEENIVLTTNISTDALYTVDYDTTINGGGYEISRADGYTGTIFSVEAGNTLTLANVVIDGGAVWTNRGTNAASGTNSGVSNAGNLITTTGNANVVLNADTILQNNDGGSAVSLATRGGGSLTLNGAQIINNRGSGSGAIWGGGNIIVNAGSKINSNFSTGSAGAIRMVSGCNFTMNGGEMNYNIATAEGGAIWGYGSSTYNLNGGEMSYNTAATGGAMYTGDSSVVNIGGDFKINNNTANQAGALRLSNRTAFNMSGGELSGNTSTETPQWNGFYGWNPGVNISGGALKDDVFIQGGLTPTVGGNGITGTVNFDLSTNHNTCNLAKDFGTINFAVSADDNFANFNFKPASDYVYTEGDEAKLVCKNAGYATYWDAATSTFRLQAE